MGTPNKALESTENSESKIVPNSAGDGASREAEKGKSELVAKEKERVDFLKAGGKSGITGDFGKVAFFDSSDTGNKPNDTANPWGMGGPLNRNEYPSGPIDGAPAASPIESRPTTTDAQTTIVGNPSSDVAFGATPDDKSNEGGKPGEAKKPFNPNASDIDKHRKLPTQKALEGVLEGTVHGPEPIPGSTPLKPEVPKVPEVPVSGATERAVNEAVINEAVERASVQLNPDQRQLMNNALARLEGAQAEKVAAQLEEQGIRLSKDAMTGKYKVLGTVLLAGLMTTGMLAHPQPGFSEERGGSSAEHKPTTLDKVEGAEPALKLALDVGGLIPPLATACLVASVAECIAKAAIPELSNQTYYEKMAAKQSYLELQCLAVMLDPLNKGWPLDAEGRRLPANYVKAAAIEGCKEIFNKAEEEAHKRDKVITGVRSLTEMQLEVQKQMILRQLRGH